MATRLRRATPGDLEGLLALGRECFGESAWSETVMGDLLEAAESGQKAFFQVAEVDSVLVGYISGLGVADEVEIHSLAVSPDWRRRGLGSRLLEAALSAAAAGGARHAFLEVRESNLAARQFYAARGFMEQRRRPRYYPDTGEAALILARPLE